jgi:hypothetical protein
MTRVCERELRTSQKWKERRVVRANAECGNVSCGAEHPDASVEGRPSEPFDTGNDPTRNDRTSQGQQPRCQPSPHMYGHAQSLVESALSHTPSI